MQESRLRWTGFSRVVLAAVMTGVLPLSVLGQDTRPPRLENPEKIRDLLLDEYPLEMRMRGIAGEARVSVLVDRKGRARRQGIVSSSGVAALDTAALKVAGELRFDPARQSGEKVETTVVLPLSFATYCGVERRAAEKPDWVRVIPSRWKEAMYDLYPEDGEPEAHPTVLLQVTVDTAGEPTKVGLLGSTGSATADSVALRMARLASFAPVTWEDRAVTARFRYVASAAPPRPPALPGSECRQSTEPRLVNVGGLRRDLTQIMRVAWKAGVELAGTARAMIYVGADGQPRQVHITHSSCWPDLDRYLQSLYEAAVFEAPTCDGTPIGSWVILPIALRR